MAHIQSIGGTGNTDVNAYFDITLPATIGNNRFVEVTVAWWRAGATSISSVAMQGGGSGTFTSVVSLQHPTNTAQGAAKYASLDVDGGNTIRVTFANVGVAYAFSVVERDDIASIDTDTVTSNSSPADDTPSITSADVTDQANEWISAACCVDDSSSNVGLDTPATVGYTNRYVNQNAGSTIALSADDKTVSSTGSQTAAWGTLAGAYNIVNLIACYRIAAAPSVTADFTGIVPRTQVQSVTLAASATSAQVGGSVTVTATVLGTDGLPFEGISVSLTSGDTGKWTVASSPLTTNASGQATFTLNAVGAGTSTLTANADSGADTDTLVLTAIAAAVPVITPFTLADARLNELYVQTLTASNNPTTWARTGALPAGITFSVDAEGRAFFAGAATELGTFSGTLTASNGQGTSAAVAWSITVRNAPASRWTRQTRDVQVWTRAPRDA